MASSEYEHDGDALLKRRRLDDLGIVLSFVADDIREERTGVHARLRILANATVLAYSTFNIDRDDERVRLANSAHKQLVGEARSAYSATYMKADLDQFCYGLWDAKQEEFAPEDVAGTSEPMPPDLIVDPFVIRGGGTIIFAPPGRGKSYTLMLMQVCVDAGLSQFWPIQRARTLFVNLERSRLSVAARLGNINQVLGLRRERELPMINARGRSLLDVARAVERHVASRGVEVVFVDSISRAGGGDLTANESANRIIDMLNHIAPSWVGLAHTPRSDESHLYGSVHFEAGADILVQLASEQEGLGPLGVGLQSTKSNDVPKGPTWLGALEFDQSGLRDVRRARPGEFPDVEGMRKLSNKEQVRQHLLDVGYLDGTQISEDLGINRSEVANILSDSRVFIKGGKVGRRQLYGVAGNGLS